MMADRKSCDLCPKNFASRSGLSFHSQTHSGGKKLNCSQCNKSFSQAGNLKKHFLIHANYVVLKKTSQELRMLSSVTLNCQETNTVKNSGSQLSE